MLKTIRALAVRDKHGARAPDPGGLMRVPPATVYRFLGIAALAACSHDPAEPAIERRGLALNAFKNSEWSAPVHLAAPVNSSARELGAELSPDGLSLYFGSDRPGGAGDVDIWAVRRECLDCAWGAAVNIVNINSLKSDGGPAFSPDGHLLFFGSGRDFGHGGDDIWMTHRENTDDDLGWEAPINLGSGVNTSSQETSPAYVPALNAGGSNLYFVRGTTLAAFDIYEARVNRDGEVLTPGTPVTELNDPLAVDGDPTVSHNGKEVFFWSQRLGGYGLSDIWVATRRNAHDPWSAPENVGPDINTVGADVTPALSHDGRTLFWSVGFAARGGLGLTDIWMSTRTPSGH